jgi:hypothetical protein
LPFERTFGPKYPEWLTKDDLAEGYKEWASKYDIVGFQPTPAQKNSFSDLPFSEYLDRNNHSIWKLGANQKAVDLSNQKRRRN